MQVRNIVRATKYLAALIGTAVLLIEGAEAAWGAVICSNERYGLRTLHERSSVAHTAGDGKIGAALEFDLLAERDGVDL